MVDNAPLQRSSNRVPQVGLAHVNRVDALPAGTEYNAGPN